MKGFWLTGFLLLLVTLSATAQNGVIKGEAYDTLSKLIIPDATVTIMKKKDSSLVSFSMTDQAGRFSITNLATGEYRLLITHVAYHNKTIYFTVDEKRANTDLGRIILNDKRTTLAEVVVSSEAPPVTLVGDTVQYNAGSFKTQPNASVEQLLKRLPGVQVDKDGTVKAQGQTVNRVLVDGKEFFGSDPKMATKNLPADAIDKVQVYDKQSEQAQLTGFDDGNSEKTINLKLKKEQKKGGFGKITGGAGTVDRYEGRFNLNSFKGARQVSAIGMANNINAEGFSFMDLMNFSGELSRMMRNGNGNANINLTQQDQNAGPIGNDNKGIRTIWGGGLNYNNIIGNKVDWTSNYFYNHYNPQTNTDIQRQYILPDSSYFYRQNNFTDNINNSHRLNLAADYAIDSFHSIRFAPKFGYQQTNNNVINNYEQYGEDDRVSNTGASKSISNSQASSFQSDLLFRKKFRRKGRTFSVNMQTSFNNSQGDEALLSLSNFFNETGIGYRKDSINQHINTAGNLSGYTVKAVYTEPLSRRSILEFSTGVGHTKSTSDKATYDYDQTSGKYEHLNDSLSNEFNNSYGFMNAGLRLRVQKKKFNYAIGFSVQRAQLDGTIVSGIKDSILTKTFINLLPVARFQYNFTKNRNLILNYRSLTNPPSISQLQPVPDISDRLNIKYGNPDLKQEFVHLLQINYMGVNPFENKNLFAFFNLMRTDDKIVNYDSLYANGVKTTKPVNVNGVYNLTGNIDLGLPVRFIKATTRVGSSLGYNRGPQFINGEKNIISTFGAGPRLALDVNPTEKIFFSINGSINYNYTTYSLQSSSNTRYFSQLYEAEYNWQLPAKFNFNTDFSYTINNHLSAGFNANVPLWNASISKLFLKYNRGELKLKINDILNRNISVSRTSNQNYIEDVRANTLKRFALLSFTYNLSKTGLGNNNGPRAMKMR